MEQIIEVVRENAEQAISVEREPLLIGGEGTLEISNDGSYDVRQYSNVEVNVVDGTQEITTEGLHDVTHAEFANVKTTHGTVEITENGLHDVKIYENASVNVQPVLTTKSITENGTYNAIDDNAQGYSSVEVDVPDTGENGLLQRLIEGTQTEDFVETRLTQLRNYAFCELNKPTINAVFENVTATGLFAFYNAKLKSLSMPNVVTVGVSGFYNSKISHILMPNVEFIGEYSFLQSALERAFYPKLIRTGGRSTGFISCTQLITCDLGLNFWGPNPNREGLWFQYFANDTNLKAIILRKETMVSYRDTSVFTNSSIASGTGYVYVPPALVSTYQAATNWVTIASQIRPFVIAENPADIQTKLNDSAIAVDTLIICDELDYDDGKYTLKIAEGQGEII